MGINSNKGIYENFTFMAPKYQGYNNVKNCEHINNFTLTSIYDDDNNSNNAK